MTEPGRNLTPAEAGDRAPFSTQIDRSLQRRVRAAVRGVAATSGGDYSLAQLTEDALTAFVARLETLYNNGNPWPHDRPLTRGRRTNHMASSLGRVPPTEPSLTSKTGTPGTPST